MFISILSIYCCFFLETLQVHKQRGTNIATAHSQRISAHFATRTNSIVVSEERTTSELAFYASSTRTGWQWLIFLNFCTFRKRLHSLVFVCLQKEFERRKRKGQFFEVIEEIRRWVLKQLLHTYIYIFFFIDSSCKMSVIIIT